MVALLAFALAACGDSSSSDTGTSASSGESTTVSDDSGGGPQAGKGKTLGIIYLIQADEAATRQGKAVEEAASRFGWKTQSIDGNLDPSKMTAAFTTLVNQGVDGIVTIDTSNTELAPSIEQADEAGVPVISIGGGAWVPGLTLDVAINDQAGAAEVGVFFYDVIAKQHGDEPVDVIEMVFPEGNPCRAREPIYQTLAAEHKNVTVTKYKVDGANAVAAASDYVSSQINQKGDSLVGVISCWGLPAQGAVAAAKKAGLDDFTVVGMNGETAEIDLIAAEDPYYKATVAYAWAWSGDEAVNWMDKVLSDEQAAIPPSGRIYIPHQLVTKDSPPAATQYEVALPKGWDPDYWR